MFDRSRRTLHLASRWLTLVLVALIAVVCVGIGVFLVENRERLRPARTATPWMVATPGTPTAPIPATMTAPIPGAEQIEFCIATWKQILRVAEGLESDGQSRDEALEHATKNVLGSQDILTARWFGCPEILEWAGYENRPLPPWTLQPLNP